MISLRDRLIGLLQNYLLLSTSIFSWTKELCSAGIYRCFCNIANVTHLASTVNTLPIGYSGEKLLFGARALDSLFISYAHSVEYNWELPA